MSVEEIKQMCDLHSEVTSEILTQKIETTQSGHPHHTFRLENEAINAATGRMRAVLTDLSTLADEDGGELTVLLERWRSCMDDLLEVDVVMTTLVFPGENCVPMSSAALFSRPWTPRLI